MRIPLSRTAIRPLALGLLLDAWGVSHAHFQELIPSTDIVTEQTGNRVDLFLAFTHPMRGGPIMDMPPPSRFGVVGPQGREDLTKTLVAETVDGKSVYRAEYRIGRPGDHVFYVAPAPYWEASEGVMILHYAKVVVDAYGSGQGWDTPAGLPVEIEPLVRPYGLWSGNLFRGVVRKAGAPVPFAKVEVEWRNDGSMVSPDAPFVTQVIKADSNGVFSYAMPRSGWWGFAALLAGDSPAKNPEGLMVPVEIGALIWVRTRNMQ